jgi:hypothetical protein
VNGPGRNKKRRFMCLRKEFREAFPWNAVELKRDGFRRWARSERIPPINVPAQHWRPMREGEPVPAATIEAFSEYIGKVKSIVSTEDSMPSRIAEDCEPPDAPKGRDRQKDAWGLGWKELYVQLSDAFKLDDEAHCADEDDLALAAAMIFECEGWRHDKRLAGRQAVAYAQDLIGCSADEYAQALLLYWKANEHAVLFPTQRRGGSVQRIGVNVSVPVSEEFYTRFRQGLEGEVISTPGHILPRSRFVFIAAMADDINIDLKRVKAARSMAHFRNILYQIAAVSEPVEKPDSALHLISYLGSKEIGKRSNTYGFTRLNSRMPPTGDVIIEFSPPVKEELSRLAYAAALGNYLPMKGLIQVYQAFIDAERRHLG